MDTKLRPCPFCGAEAHYLGFHCHWVTCTVCGATSKNLPSEKKAVEAWNKREEVVKHTLKVSTREDIEELMGIASVGHYDRSVSEAEDLDFETLCNRVKAAVLEEGQP